MKFGLLTVAVSIALAFLAGCNTVKGTVDGAGKDIHAVTHPNSSSHSQQTSTSKNSNNN
jgi:predicted small secreted protein